MRRALLIGSETHGLTGVKPDIELMTALLGNRDFTDIRICCENATRAGILAAMRKLIDDCAPGDAIVLYYSGHGAHWERVDSQTRRDGRPSGCDFIVPLDIDDSTDDDFRGITAWELSRLVVELSARTHNITAIMDCCHAGRMVKGAQVQPTADGAPPERVRFLANCSTGIARHLARLKADTGMDSLYPEANSHVVRLLACSPTQQALEVRRDGGRTYHGLFTSTMAEVLDAPDCVDTSWYLIGNAINQRVSKRVTSQCPAIEGPVERVPFELREHGNDPSLLVYRHDDRLMLRGGSLLDIHEGDEYALMPFDAPRHQPDRELARVTVEHVWSDVASLSRPMYRDESSYSRGHLRAFVVASRSRERCVAIDPAPAPGLPICEHITGSRYLRVASSDESEHAIARVMVRDGMIWIEDASGLPIHDRPWPETSDGYRAVISVLERLSKMRALLSLATGAGASELPGGPDTFDIRWGLVVQGERRPLARQGTLLHAGDALYIDFHNQYHRERFINIYDVGIAGHVSLLSISSGSGVVVRPGEHWVLGRDLGDRLRGICLSWPLDVPRDVARPETLVIVISDRPLDLRPLQTRRFEDRVWRDAVLPSGSLATHEEAGYAVERIEFELSPEPRPATGGSHQSTPRVRDRAC